MTPCTITRTTEVAAPLADSWDLIGTARGLARWLGSDLRLEGDDEVLAVGSVATVIDDLGAMRRLVVTDLDDGRRIGFTWWDDADPGLASQVTLGVEAARAGTTITATETVDAAALGAAGGRASALVPAAVHDLTAADLGWGDRLDRLARRFEPCLALVGV